MLDIANVFTKSKENKKKKHLSTPDQSIDRKQILCINTIQNDMFYFRIKHGKKSFTYTMREN